MMVNNPRDGTLNLRALTLNVWGVPTAKERRERMRAIGQAIGQLGVDVAVLQEAWLEGDRQVILSEASQFAGYHAFYFNSNRSFGSGMLLLSRFPIQQMGFSAFPANGSPEKLREMDYYGGKGVGFARLVTPAGPFDVYTLHTVARYQTRGLDVYHAQRVAQLYYALRFISRRSDGHPMIAAGDFNTWPDSFGYQLLTLMGGLRDLFRQVYPKEDGDTYRTDNPYTSNAKGERIDYIFYRGGQRTGIRPGSVELISRGDGTTGRQPAALSDHSGLLAAIELSPAPAPASVLPRLDARSLALLSGEAARGEEYVREQRNRLLLKLSGGVLSTMAAQRLRILPAVIRHFIEAGAIGLTLFNLYHLSYLMRTELKEYEQILQEVEILRNGFLRL